jgi:sulfur carrier protein ThiS
MREVFDEIRSCWVAATPEEIVRQLWIKKMVQELGFPKELIAVEKELKALPHLASAPVPDRRIDVLCFTNTESLVPLLLMECKAEQILPKAIEQVMGYNLYVQAPFVAIANDREICFRYNQCILNRLPSYTELLAYARCRVCL